MTLPEERIEDNIFAIIMVGTGITLVTVIVITYALLFFAKAYYGV